MTAPTTAPNSPARRYRPLLALGRAEYLQFRRNKTLVVMGTVFPIGMPLLLFFGARGGGAPQPAGVSTTIEIFALMALLMVQYYSVLSLVTTRRGEGVLKRLRTGEAADWQILSAPAVPGLLLTGIGTAVVLGAIYLAGAAAPVNAALLAIALLGGIVVFTLLALATSAVTRNAEAAQITSIPVMTVAMLGMGSIRSVLPDRLADLADFTPFAAVSDLIQLGVVGLPYGAAEGAAPASFGGAAAEAGLPLVTLAVWMVLALALALRCFRWDDR